jgi:membrane protein DedA with SNARE-associated domain
MRKIDDFIRNVSDQLQTLPIWGIILFSFLSACIQQVFPPYPSELLLLLLGGLAVTDVIAGPAAILPYIAGTVFSSLLLFYLSRRIGKPVLKNRYVARIFSRRNQRRAAVYMRRYGAPALGICKFLPGVNTVCLIVAGVMGLRGPAPMLTISVAGIVENTLFFLAGMFIGNRLPDMYRFTKQFSIAAVLIAAALIAIFLFFKFNKRIIQRIRRPSR